MARRCARFRRAEAEAASQIRRDVSRARRGNISSLSQRRGVARARAVLLTSIGARRQNRL